MTEGTSPKTVGDRSLTVAALIEARRKVREFVALPLLLGFAQFVVEVFQRLIAALAFQIFL